MGDKQEESVGSTSHKVEKERSFSMEFNRDVVEYAQTHNISATAIKFKVDRQCISDWKRKIDSINSSKSVRKRMAGAGRKITSDDVEERLVLWIHERRSRMLRVSRKTK